MPKQKQRTLSQAMVSSGAPLMTKQYKRVSSLVLWHQGRTLDSKKVFCYSYGRVCGFPGGEVKPFESYPDALRRVIQDKCTFPPSMEDWVKSAVSKSSALHLTSVKWDFEMPQYIVTIRMYALKLPHMFSHTKILPKIKVINGFQGIACSVKHTEVVPQWKYYGSIAPRMRVPAQRECLKLLLDKASMVSAYGPHTPLISQFVPKNMLNAAQTLSKLGTSFEAKATIESVSEGNPKTPVMFDIFSGTGSVGRVFSDDLHWKVYSIDICKKSAKRSRGVCADVLNFDFSSWPQPDLSGSAHHVHHGLMQRL
jgi:hypothetical protein